MKTVWKCNIQPNSLRGEPYEIRISAKVGARAVSVGLQNGIACVWFEADPEQEDEEMVLYSIGTGFGCMHEDMKRFIGSIVQGQYAWHIYAKD